jgi:hypothetical protein
VSELVIRTCISCVVILLSCNACIVLYKLKVFPFKLVFLLNLKAAINI